MGKTCEPKAFSFQCMTEFTPNKKKKKGGIFNQNFKALSDVDSKCRKGGKKVSHSRISVIFF